MHLSPNELIRREALRLGFDFIGFAKATELTEEGRRLEEWLNKGYHGTMSYMANHFEKRIDPRLLVEGAKSVIVLLHNYYAEDAPIDAEAPKIARYAFGKDYHIVLKEKLKNLLTFIRTDIGEVAGRCFVDSAPVMEREWAKKTGLGWLGKNTLLINKGNGSYYFLAVIICDLVLEYDSPIKDYCGTCTRCIDACPTEAISPQGYILDASRCISYLTIELKTAIPEEFHQKMEGWAFGCDICQEVCPWNRFASEHKEPAFRAAPELLNMSQNDWLDLSEEVFNELFRHSPIKRTKYEKLKQTLRLLK